MIQKPVLIDAEVEREFRLKDGRLISFREYGAANGRVVLALHGTPGSRLKYRIAHEAAAARGMRIVAPDRWGYGLSQPPQIPSLRLYSQDISELMRALGHDVFSVFGISGGGPFAAALAAELPTKVCKLALVAPVGQISRRCFSNQDIYAENPLRPFHRFCFLGLPRIPGATRVIFWLYRLAMLHAPASAVKIALLRSSVPDKRAMLSAKIRRSLGQTFAAGLQHGVSGPVIDLNLFTTDWDFATDAICCDTRVWIGEDDLNVPIGGVLALARDIPGSSLSFIPGQGHFWISENFGDVLDWLACKKEEELNRAHRLALPDSP